MRLDHHDRRPCANLDPRVEQHDRRPHRPRSHATQQAPRPRLTSTRASTNTHQPPHDHRAPPPAAPRDAVRGEWLRMATAGPGRGAAVIRGPVRRGRGYFGARGFRGGRSSSCGLTRSTLASLVNTSDVGDLRPPSTAQRWVLLTFASSAKRTNVSLRRSASSRILTAIQARTACGSLSSNATRRTVARPKRVSLIRHTDMLY